MVLGACVYCRSESYRALSTLDYACIVVFRILAALAGAAGLALGQQIPFIPVSGPNAPKGGSFLLVDKIRGGLWLGSGIKGAEGISYFDGTRFITPLSDRFPGVLVTAGLAEDAAGGIWLTTSTGLYRLFRGHWKQYTSNPVTSIVEAAPDVFLITTTRNLGQKQVMDLIRVALYNGKWTVQTLLSRFPSKWLKLNHDGNVLFACPGGYCELRGTGAVDYSPDRPVRIQPHAVPGSDVLGPDYRVLQDRLGCVWLRNETKLLYQCPGDRQARAPSEQLVGSGAGVTLELEDGSIVVSSIDKLAIGRPGHFRIITALNGFPAVVSPSVTKDGSFWISSANGLFVFPQHLPMEFWTERDGLAGSTWGIQRTSKGTTFALAGRELEVLDRDRSRWRILPLGRPIDRMVAGPDDSVLAGNLSTDMLRISSEGKILGDASIPAEEMGNGIVSAATGSWTCSERGLFRQIGGEWRSFLIDGQPLRGACRDLAIDRNGNIWFDLQEPQDDFGVVQDPNGNHPRVVMFKTGSDLVRFLGVDKRGWIWRGSPFGVYVADLEEALHGEWLFLNHLDGIAGIDANRRSFFSDADGSVWFGADFSINHLSPPEDLVHPAYAPDVFISAFSTNGGVPVMADLIGTMKSSASVTAYIGSLQFDRRNALRVRYRLLPEQSSWRETTNLDLSLGSLAPAYTHSKCRHASLPDPGPRRFGTV